MTGLRTEELRALRWSDVNLDAGAVAVYRSVRVTGDTRTRKGRRVLGLPQLAVQALREHHKLQAADRLGNHRCMLPRCGKGRGAVRSQVTGRRQVAGLLGAVFGAAASMTSPGSRPEQGGGVCGRHPGSACRRG
jgi:integrase